MSKLVLNGDTSGSVTLDAPAVSGTTTLTLPTTSGTVLTTASTFGGTGPAFYANKLGAQSLTSGAVTKIQINSEVFDTNNNYDPTTNYRFTPTVAGYYQVSASVMLTNNVNNIGSYTMIYKNGNSIAAASSTASTNTYSGPSVSILTYMNGSSDYLEVYAISVGGTYSTNGGAFTVGDSTFFSAFLARAA